jgi:sec-independent protein translocase protein TatA
MITPLIAGLGTQELVLILIVVVLLFGASKLPELARGSGRALRIFKAETKGLMDDEDEGTKTPEQRELEARQALQDAERERLERERLEREQRPDTTA